MRQTESSARLKRIFSNPAWALVAAFGTYFCMYGFRKPYTAATYADASFLGINYKILLIIAQTIGYVIAKWVGIKIVSEIKHNQRIKAILGLILFAELMLLLFGIVPRPWNIVCLLLNGLPLGVIFGLVLGFLEGRKNTEFLIAGLCASFIVSDGVSKSVGALLLGYGVSENWMPFFAGLVFLVPTLIFIAMLACVPLPSATDIAARSAREPMKAEDRWHFFWKYAPGLIGIIAVYLFVTLLRSVRADFAVELWAGLGYHQTPALFTQSELLVSFGVIIVNGAVVLILNHYKAFRFSLFICMAGFAILLASILGLSHGLGTFSFMVMLGLGVYLPYVAIHTIVFERLIAITREKANVGFLMYIVDSVGYTGYIGLMFLRYAAPSGYSILNIYLKICIVLGIVSGGIVLFCFWYFKIKLKGMNNKQTNFPQGKAAVFNGAGLPFEFIDRQVPFIKPGEILVKNLYTTLCGSDIHTYCGRRIEPAQVVLGHEIVGEILWIDPAHTGKDFNGNLVKVGDRITWSIFSVPADVTAPRVDMPQKSDQLFKYGHALAIGDDVFNGGLADYCVLHANTAMLKISTEIPIPVAATISCAHATVTGALRVAGDLSGKKVLIFGAGLLGLSCVAMCKEAGASWIGLIDNDESRLHWGQKFAADDSYAFPAADNLDTLPWPEADFVFDMTGNPLAMKVGLDSLALGGIAIWIGAVFPEKPVPVDAQKVVRKLLQIRGLHNYNYEDFVNATAFIENNYLKYPFEALIEKEYPLDEVAEAFTFATASKPVRVGIKISDPA
jgi:putative phosphonate catabolism associated alcohol dehydrogenase